MSNMERKIQREETRGSKFSLPMNQVFASNYNTDVIGGAKRESGALAQVYIDSETISSQRESAISSVESQAEIAKTQAKAEYEAQKAALQMRFEREIAIAEAAIEQSKQRAIFVLEQQHQQRKLEIEQKSQEQRLQIEAAANEMIMQSQQQRLDKEMSERFAKLNMNPAGGSTLFSSSRSFGDHQSLPSAKVNVPRVQTFKMPSNMASSGQHGQSHM